MQQKLYRDLTEEEKGDYFTGDVPDTFEVWYVGGLSASAPPEAANRVDALTVALHELGHALGLTSAAAETEIGDYEYDFNPDFVNGAEMAVHTAGSGKTGAPTGAGNMAARTSVSSRNWS